ncbi:MAG: nucleotidyltransferase family protein [Bacteroidota bacterium]
MNPKETLWFVGKCLSLSNNPEKTTSIRKLIQSGKLNWNSLVYQSSNQLMIPALYLNLHRNNLLNELPADLSSYFKEITDLNRERNQSILNQINRLTKQLNENQLKPVFLKGTAHLIDGLYEDIGERMIGDIDFILQENEAYKAYQILIENGYVSTNDYAKAEIGEGKHFPRIIHKNEIAAVEVHGKLLKGNYHKLLNWDTVKDNVRACSSLNGAYVLADSDLILHNIFNAQLNDDGHAKLRTFLRQSYDMMLLSKRKDPLIIGKMYGKKFNQINAYLAHSADLLDYPETLKFENNRRVKLHLWKIDFIWRFPQLAKAGRMTFYIFWRIYRYFKTFILFFFDTKTRKRVVRSLSNKSYYIAHFQQYKAWS